MKKLFTITALVICASVASAAFLSKGYGSKVTADPTPVTVELGGWVHSLSIMNDGAVDVYAAVNSSLVDFTAAVGAGTTVIIPPGATYTFDTNDRSLKGIQKYSYAAESSTAVLYVSGY